MFERAIEIGLQGFAITDHECLSAHVQAIQTYKSLLKDGKITEDFKLGLGDEIYLVDDATREGDRPYGFTHFILVAKNKEGYRKIKEISSTAWGNSFNLRNMERVPISKKQLKDIIGNEKGNIVATTACLGGELARLTLKMIEAEQTSGFEDVRYYKSKINDFMLYCIDLFGDDFHVEIQPSHSIDQLNYNKRVLGIAKFYNVKTVFATDSHYLKKEDRLIHKSYLNSKEGEREVDDFYATAYMMDAEEMFNEYFSEYMTIEEYNEMAMRTRNIGHQIEFYDLFHPQFIPEVEVGKYDKIDSKLGYEFLDNMLSSDFDQDRYWVNECYDHPGSALEGVHAGPLLPHRDGSGRHSRGHHILRHGQAGCAHNRSIRLKSALSYNNIRGANDNVKILNGIMAVRRQSKHETFIGTSGRGQQERYRRAEVPIKVSCLLCLRTAIIPLSILTLSFAPLILL